MRRPGLLRRLIDGRPDASGKAIVARAASLDAAAAIASNVIGALVVVVLAVFVLPHPAVEDRDEVVLVNLVTASIYLVVAVAIGTLWGLARLRRTHRWLIEDRRPDDEEQARALRLPLAHMRMIGVLWLAAVVVFTVLNARWSGILALTVGITVFLGGATTCAISYLLVERVTRPAAARALAYGAPDRPLLPGVMTRAHAGLGTRRWRAHARPDRARDLRPRRAPHRLAAARGNGALAQRGVAARGPVRDLAGGAQHRRPGACRCATRCARWRAATSTPRCRCSTAASWDCCRPASTAWCTGCASARRSVTCSGARWATTWRARPSSAASSWVARRCEVAVLFVDVMGSTEFASERPPTEVVERLNEFFGVVVDVVEEHGGWVNKFEGDAALAVFGAPVPSDDAAGAALAAARELAGRLPDEVAELDAGIGVSAGKAVAGNVGAESRFEYTVIGDPVNEAARLSDSPSPTTAGWWRPRPRSTGPAKRRPGTGRRGRRWSCAGAASQPGPPRPPQRTRNDPATRRPEGHGHTDRGAP